jgi:hypothetical protein
MCVHYCTGYVAQRQAGVQAESARGRAHVTGSLLVAAPARCVPLFSIHTLWERDEQERQKKRSMTVSFALDVARSVLINVNRSILQFAQQNIGAGSLPQFNVCVVKIKRSLFTSLQPCSLQTLDTTHINRPYDKPLGNLLILRVQASTSYRPYHNLPPSCVRSAASSDFLLCAHYVRPFYRPHSCFVLLQRKGQVLHVVLSLELSLLCPLTPRWCSPRRSRCRL